MAFYGYTYDRADQRVRAEREDGSYWHYQYDDLGQVTFGGKYNAQGRPLPGHGFSYGYDSIGNRKQSTKLATPVDDTRDNNRDQRSDYQANLLNQYQQRTVPSIAELLGQSDPRANLTARATDSEGNQLHATLEREGENFRVATQVDNRNESTETNFEVEANLQDEATTRTAIRTTSQTPVRYEHDADGNLVSDESWHYEWNGENRLVRMYSRQTIAPENRKQLDFAYDANGRRIEKIVSHWDKKKKRYKKNHEITFVYGGWNLIRETLLQTQGTVDKTYLWGLDLTQTTGGGGGIGGLVATKLTRTPSQSLRSKKTVEPESYFRLPLYNGTGSVIALFQCDKRELVVEYEYGPFGEFLQYSGEEDDRSGFRYSTKYVDSSTGLYYFGLRYLTPRAGRWLKRDPFDERGGKHLYSFCRNSTANSYDPIGLMSVSSSVVNYSFTAYTGVGVNATVAGTVKVVGNCNQKSPASISGEYISVIGTTFDSVGITIPIGGGYSVGLSAEVSVGFSGPQETGRSLSNSGQCLTKTYRITYTVTQKAVQLLINRSRTTTGEFSRRLTCCCK